MDSVAELGTEDVVDEAVLRDAVQAAERRRGDDSVEVVTVSGHGRTRAGDSGLDPPFKLVWRHRHGPSVASTHRYTE